MDISRLRRVYIIGIKGSGVAAIVEILLARGITVTGSDTAEKFFTDLVLQRLGVKYAEGFSETNIPEDIDAAIYSTAYSEANNVEMRFLKERGVPMISYPEALSVLFNEKIGLAVCGTHGKTTTTAMLGSVLQAAELEPTVVVGSRVNEWGTNSLVGNGKYFVIEADEYQNKLALYRPHGAILTSLDHDHPDCFPTLADYKKVFRDFVASIPRIGFLAVWGDSTDVLDVVKAARTNVLTYGFGKDNTYVIENVVASIEKDNSSPRRRVMQRFLVTKNGETIGEFETVLAGKHNVLNAAAVVALCHHLKIDSEAVKRGIAAFSGTARRFQYIGECNGAALYDDYAHHPEEIKATLGALRELYPEKNIIAVFHPHTFSRTAALLQEFSQSFDLADQAIVMDIYASAREEQGTVSSADLVSLINRYIHGKAEYVPTIDGVVEQLKDSIGADDVVIALGAGNGWEVVEKLKN